MSQNKPTYEQGKMYEYEQIGRILVEVGHSLEDFYRMRHKAEEAGNDAIYRQFDEKVKDARAFIAFFAMEQANFRRQDA